VPLDAPLDVPPSFVPPSVVPPSVVGPPLDVEEPPLDVLEPPDVEDVDDDVLAPESAPAGTTAGSSVEPPHAMIAAAPRLAVEATKKRRRGVFIGILGTASSTTGS
jgi:hypothetical protein